MTDNLYRYWHAEFKTPGQSRDVAGEPTDGFWRANAAKTKPDHPVAIWHEGDEEIIQIGNRKIVGASRDGHDFRDGTWQHCTAITQAQYDEAVSTGFWADGKPARRMDENERMGIDTSTGDNAAPIEDSLSDQIAALADIIDKTPEPTSQDEANTLSGRLDKMRALLKLAEAQRVTEKEPHLQASRDVDAKWKAIGEPGGNAYRAGEERRKAFLRKEQAKLDAAAAEARRIAQEEADAENERRRVENQKRIDEANDFGGDQPDEPELLPEVVAAPVEAARATAGSSFGKSSGLKKVTVIDNIDIVVLTNHFISTVDADFTHYLDDRAKKAIRAKITLPGVTTKEQLQ